MYLVLFSVYEKLLNKADCKVNMNFFFSLRNPVLAEKLVNMWVLFRNTAPPPQCFILDYPSIGTHAHECAMMHCQKLFWATAGSGD